VGVQSLVALLGAFQPGARVYLDVLGGEGYVWRLMEAKRQLAQRQVVEVPRGAFGDGSSVPAPLAELLTRTALADPEAVVLAVEADGGDLPFTGRLVALDEARVMVSRPFPLSGHQVVDWLHRFPSPGTAGPLGAMARARGSDPLPVMITNDVSQHMFFRAGLWGMPTREDALKLSRTFRPESLDGVLAAYGTHHIPDIYTAIRESHALLKPGGVMVVHDFFDRGPVGNWFHDVVDPYSKTGHDMPHLGPVEMVVDLFRAGFRGVELMEIEDPFIFTAEPGDRLSAREIALRYTMGMYGMTHHFAERLDELEKLVHDVLAYPELGQAALFEQDFAFIPRRAIVARARKAAPGEGGRFSESDAALVRTLEDGLRASRESLEQRSGAPAAATRSWFGADGERWGVPAAAQREFLEWVGAQRAAGALS
jgi:SAM-dependent methyltransferase